MVQIIWEIRPALAFILSAQPIKYFSSWIKQCALCKRKKTRFKYMNTEKRWGYIGLCQILIFPIFQVDGYSDGKPDETLVNRRSLSLQQARKLQATLVRVRNYHRLTHSLTGVKCRATSVAKNILHRLQSQSMMQQKIILVSKHSLPQIRALVLQLRVPLSFASAFGFLPKTHFETYTRGQLSASKCWPLWHYPAIRVRCSTGY